MPDWVKALEKPWWYPGDEILSLANQMFALVYPLFLFVFIVVVYRIIKEGWSWWLTIPFLGNILTTFAFVIIGARYETLWGTALDVLGMWLFLVWTLVLMYRRSYWLMILILPYAIWLTIFLGIYGSLLRVN